MSLVLGGIEVKKRVCMDRGKILRIPLSLSLSLAHTVSVTHTLAERHSTEKHVQSRLDV